MRAIGIIASNTFREIIRDRILYGIVVFALLLISLSIALGELSFSEQARISANFGFAGIQLATAVLAVFIGSTLVSREIEKQTILTLLARPLTRTQFLLGKYLGLIQVIVVVMTGLSLVLFALVQFLGLEVGGGFLLALWGILLEGFILIALTMFFGVFSRPVMSVIFSSALFLVGHWITTLDGLLKKASETFKQTVTVLQWIVPNFEKFNWRSAPIYSIEVPASDIIAATLYALGWIVFLVAATSIIFRRRDFV